VGNARVTAMSEARLEEWRASAAAAGQPLPAEIDDDGHDPVEVVLDDVVVGGAIITYDDEGGRRRAHVRRLETTLSHDDSESWPVLLRALEAHVRAREARVVVTAVPPSLAGVFGTAGYLATMTTVSKRMDPDSVHELQDDQRVTLRYMDAAERRRYAQDAVGLARAGMERAGVTGTDASLGDLADRIAAIAGDPVPEGELLLVGLLDGVPIGRLWATLVTTDDGHLDFLGNLVDLFPEFRGRRLTPSFLGALRRHLDTLGVRDVQGRLYAHDAAARRTVVEEGAGIADVHLRKELGGS
jgi:hypothetical protein